MAKPTDENRDDEPLDEAIPAEGEEEDDTSSETENDDAVGEEDDEEDSEEGSDDEDEDEEEGEDEEDGAAFKIPEKLKGKSAAEIAKIYTDLESHVNEKALELAQSILKKKGVQGADEKAEDEAETTADVDLFEGMTDEQIAAMKPREFAKLMSQKIMEQATKIAHNTIEKTNEVRVNVSRDIRETTKAHPHLKTNPEYREIVISLIEAAAGKGETLTLQEACKKADKALNIKPAKPAEEKEEEGGEGKPPKKKKTGMERTDGGGNGRPETDGDRIRQGMVNAGGGNGFLGGLG